MNDAILRLSYGDLVLATLFLLAPAALSLRRRLGVHRELAVGALRCFGQLMAVGYLLKYVFAINAWPLVCGVLAAMVLAGGRIAAQRQDRPLPGLFRLTTVSMTITSLITLAFTTVVLLQVKPWYDPRYVLPLAGMIIGNAMNGSALAAERLHSEMRLRRQEIETYLALGATPAQASHEAVRATVRAALIPAVNSLMSVGIVHLPGMMTGQILSGTSPLTATHYQIVIMYMMVFVTAATAILMTTLAYRRYFTARMQLESRYLLEVR